ncbi:MAG: hypothetical protein V1678_00705 [Candidatus Aenigmatarchaeota archaeon]
MGLLSPYVYKTKEGKKYWLHMKKKGKTTLYYFSKDPVSALFNIPGGFEVTKNSKQDFPMLKKKAGGFFGGGLKKSKPNKEEASGQEPAQ